MRQVKFGGGGADVFSGGDNGDHLYGGLGADVLSGGAGADYLEGQLGDDVLEGEAGRDTLLGGQNDDALNGGAGEDYLMGGAGDDTLDGGAQADRLEGGAGIDVYVLSSANKSNDVLRDSDGLGVIRLDGAALNGGEWIAPGQWQDKARGITYSFNPDASGRGTLTLTSEAGIVTVGNFAAGELGITLSNAPAVTPPPPVDRTIQGDLAPIDFDPATPGVQLGYDDIGNVIVDPNVSEADRVDTLHDSTGNDKLIGAGGDDVIHADRGGNDWLDTGSGDDLATAGAGNDTVEGFVGYDRLFGGTGDDELYAVGAENLDTAIMNGETGTGGPLKGDWLDGGPGSDTLVGGLDNDALLGGGGNDILVGGRGDDFLMGDETSDTWDDWGSVIVNPDWSITRQVTTRADGLTEHKRNYAQASAWVDPQGGADLLYGGAGDDWMFGNLGNDALLGGADRDVLFGKEGNDLLYGQDGDDTLSGDSIQDTDGSGIPGGLHGADMLDGGAGNDRLNGNGGDDKLYGGDGNDELGGDDGVTPGNFHGSDYLDGQAGNDTLWGDGGNDELFGGEGDDYLEGDSSTLDAQYHGDDYLDGESGSDHMLGDSGKDTLFGGDGDDTLSGDFSTLDGQYHDVDYLEGEAGNDFIVGDGGADTLLGGDGDDRLTGDNTADYVLAAQYQGADILDGGKGADILWGGGGDDRLFGGADNDTVQGGEGNDAAEGGGGEDVLFGEAGNDELSGGDGADQLLGNEGNDLISGGAGNDSLWGDDGDDTYPFDAGDGADLVEDTSGQDRIRFGAGIQASGLTIDSYWANGAQYLYIGYGATDSVAIKGGLLGAIESYEFADGTVLTQADLLGAAPNLYIQGTNQSETIQGGGAADQLLGLGGDDLLLGGKGHDGLYGDIGNDTLIGGLGDDYLSGDAGSDTYSFTRGDGDDVIGERLGVAAAADIDVLLFDASIAPADVTATRNQADLLLTVNGGGSVRVQGYFSYPDDSYAIEQIRFADGTVWNNATLRAQAAIPSPLDDSLYGTSGNDTIDGLGGNDFIDGGAGNDMLFGGDGNDTVYGQTGDDLLDGGPCDDTLYGGVGSDSYFLRIGSGNDVVWEFEYGSPGDVDTIFVGPGVGPQDVIPRRSWYNYSPDDLQLIIGAIGPGGYIQSSGNSLTVRGYFARQDALYKVERVVFEDGTVWDYAHIRAMVDRVTEGRDVALGYDWDDTIDVLGGDDYVDARAGNDQVQGGTGNDSLLGNAGNDTLTGGAGADTLDGGDDADTLEGGAGNDKLKGGAGNDTYIFGRGDGNDVVDNYDAGAGKVNGIRLKNDVLPSAVSLYRHGDDLVVVIDDSPTQMWVTSAFDGSGNYRIDQISFKDGTVWGVADISARAASGTIDTQTGTTGNDTFLVDHPGDVITELADQGTDTVQSWVSYTLPSNVENLTLTGVLNISGGGNSLSNVIRKNAGNNYLVVNGGIDTIYGGMGDDVFEVFDGAPHVFIEAPGEGTDTLRFRGGTLPDNIENLVLNGNGFGTAIGNSLDNLLVGGSQANTLDGKAGADTMMGGWGEDSYVVDDPGDQVVEENQGWGNDVDTVQSSISYVLGPYLENLTLLGAAPITGTGNKLNNVVDGAANTSGNVLTGGKGDDKYILGEGDVAVEVAGEGNDTVQIAAGPVGAYGVASYANIENIYLGFGVGASTVVGDKGDNVLSGNVFANAIIGGAGNDKLYAGGLADPVYWRNGIQYGGYQQYEYYGNDTLDGGEGDDTLRGGSGAELLVGGVGNDALVGGDGNDMLDGGVGDDVLNGGNGQDVYRYALGDGNDVIDYYNGDILRFDGSVSTEYVGMERRDDDLVLTVGEGGSVKLAGWLVFHTEPSVHRGVRGRPGLDGRRSREPSRPAPRHGTGG